MDDASAMAERTDDRSTRTATTRYGADAQAWALEQAALRKAGRFGDLDLIDLAVDVADMAARDDAALEGDWSRMLQHLSAWDMSSERLSRSWVRAIEDHRRKMIRRLVRSPHSRDEVMTREIDWREL